MKIGIVQLNMKNRILCKIYGNFENCLKNKPVADNNQATHPTKSVIKRKIRFYYLFVERIRLNINHHQMFCVLNIKKQKHLILFFSCKVSISTYIANEIKFKN